MSNGKGIALIEAAIRNALATKTGLGYNEIDLKNLARYTIGNWKYVEAEIDVYGSPIRTTFLAMRASCAACLNPKAERVHERPNLRVVK